jgi:uncharacterized membrane protein (DUF2068 family)
VRETLPLNTRSLGVLRLIAVFKFCKAALVIVTGFGLLRFYEPSVQIALYRLLGGLPYAFEQHLLREAIAFLSGMSPKRIQIIAVATFAYAGLFVVEGVGLWRGLHWAEVLTVVATSSLIPIEIYELAKHPSPNKVLVIVVNVAILGYLLWRLRREAAARHATAAAAHELADRRPGS